MRAYLLSVFILLAGCASLLGHDPQSLFIKNVDWPLVDLGKVAKANLPVGLGSTSSNGRTLRSKFFYPTRKEYKDGTDAADRYVAQFILLGDGRPYEIEVTVYHERRTFSGDNLAYVVVGVDENLTQELRDKLEAELTKRREDRNVIDDFRVY